MFTTFLGFSFQRKLDTSFTAINRGLEMVEKKIDDQVRIVMLSG